MKEMKEETNLRLDIERRTTAKGLFCTGMSEVHF